MKRAKTPPRVDPPPPDRIGAVIESLLFVADEPQPIDALAKSLNVKRDRIEQAIDELSIPDGRGIFVQRQGDRVQLATAPDSAPYIEQFLEVEHGRLSNASLETLAIVAYRQPMTRGGIDSVRGVNSDAAVATLLARGLIEEVGRAPGPGRPALFGTTVRFLEYFGLSRPDALPPLPHIEGEGGSNGASNGAAVDGVAEHTNGHAEDAGWQDDEVAADGADAAGEDDLDEDEASEDDAGSDEEDADWPDADASAGDSDEPDLPPDARAFADDEAVLD
jgi:segregation and condensation protein B